MSRFLNVAPAGEATSQKLAFTDVMPLRSARRRLRLLRIVEAPVALVCPPPPPAPFSDLEVMWFALGEQPVFLRCYVCAVECTDFFDVCVRCGAQLHTLVGDATPYTPERSPRFIPVGTGERLDELAWVVAIERPVP